MMHQKFTRSWSDPPFCTAETAAASRIPAALQKGRGTSPCGVEDSAVVSTVQGCTTSPATAALRSHAAGKSGEH